MNYFIDKMSNQFITGYNLWPKIKHIHLYLSHLFYLVIQWVKYTALLAGKNGMTWVIKKKEKKKKIPFKTLSFKTDCYCIHEKQKKCQDVHQTCVCMSKQASQSKRVYQIKRVCSIFLCIQKGIKSTRARNAIQSLFHFRMLVGKYPRLFSRLLQELLWIFLSGNKDKMKSISRSVL